MARLWSRPEIKLKMSIEMDEEEVRALEAIMSYDTETFLRMFYEKMGRTYLEKHEDGLRRLFEVRSILGLWIKKVEIARKEFEDNQ